MMSGLEKILVKLEEGSARGPSADRNRTSGRVLSLWSNGAGVF